MPFSRRSKRIFGMPSPKLAISKRWKEIWRQIVLLMLLGRDMFILKMDAAGLHQNRNSKRRIPARVRHAGLQNLTHNFKKVQLLPTSQVVEPDLVLDTMDIKVQREMKMSLKLVMEMAIQIATLWKLSVRVRSISTILRLLKRNRPSS